MAPDRKYSNEDMIEELRRVAEQIGKSPTCEEFNEKSDMWALVISERFGSWNAAKEEAGLETYVYRSGGNKPTGSKADIYRDAKDTTCLNCDEDFLECLVFHHLPEYEKSFNVSRYRQYSPTKKKLEEEIDKCVVLCANCHRKVHSDNHHLTIQSP